MKNKKRKDIEWRYFSPRGFSEMEWYVAFILVVTSLLLGWTSIMSMLGFNISFSNILYLHDFLFTWIFDIVVVGAMLLVLYISNYRKTKLKDLERKVRTLNEEIEGSIIIADDIRDGHDINADDLGHSQLAQTLLNLGANLKETRIKEQNFTWVSKGKEQISDILRIHTEMEELAHSVIEQIVSYYEAAQAAFFIREGDMLRTVTQYAYGRKRFEKQDIKIGIGLIGAAAYERQIIYRTEIPDDYFTITSGLMGHSKPKSLLIIPLKQEDEVLGVIEISFFQGSLPQHFMELAEEIGVMVGGTLSNLRSTERTKQLLKDSQEMTETLRKNEEQLNQNAREMKEARDNLEVSNAELARKIDQINIQQKKQDAMLSNASEFISIYNANREVVYESPSMKRILGYEQDEDVHGMDEEWMMPNSFKKVTAMFDYLLDTPGGEKVIEYTYLKKNSERIYLETQGRNLLHDPAIRGLIFNTRDVTERKMRENEEKKTGRMKSLSENSPDVIIRTSLKGKILYANPAAAKFLGLESAEAAKECVISELLEEESFSEFVVSVLKTVKKSKQKESAELQMGEKVKKFMEIKGIPEFDDGGAVDSVLFTMHDVTEIKLLEQEAQKAKEDVMSSINYAKRIQFALLPEQMHLKDHFPNSFMFYRPKNVVSGDFPWLFHKDDVTYMAVVDCTGHGVPGALLSIIGYLMLDNIVSNNPELTPAEVLDILHESVRDALKQRTSDANAGDGMDLGLIRLDHAKRELQFAGAHRPMYFLRRKDTSLPFDGEDNCIFKEYDGTRKGIGGKPLPNGRKEKSFANNIIEYNDGDRFFIFSDGLPDQLGGEEHKKFFTRRVKEWLARNVNESIAATSRDLEKTFYEWKGFDKQVDDVLLIGVEL